MKELYATGNTSKDAHLVTPLIIIFIIFREKFFVEDMSTLDEIEVTVDYTPPDAVIKRTEVKVKLNPDLPMQVVPNVHRPEMPQTADSAFFRQTSSRERGDRTSSRASSIGISHRTSSQSGADQAGQYGQTFTFVLTFQSADYTIVDYHFMTDTL